MDSNGTKVAEHPTFTVFPANGLSADTSASLLSASLLSSAVVSSALLAACASVGAAVVSAGLLLPHPVIIVAASIAPAARRICFFIIESSSFVCKYTLVSVCFSSEPCIKINISTDYITFN